GCCVGWWCGWGLSGVGGGGGRRGGRTPVDLPIMGLLICYIVSFYNIAKPSHLPFAFGNTLQFVSTLAMFYLIVNNIRDDRDLMRIHRFYTISLVIILALCMFELTHPGAVVLRGWIKVGGAGDVFNTRNVRIGGPFLDYELLCEFAALNVLLTMFWMLRARTMASKTFRIAMFLVMAFTLFATVTRGGVIALLLVLGWLFWRVR